MYVSVSLLCKECQYLCFREAKAHKLKGKTQLRECYASFPFPVEILESFS